MAALGVATFETGLDEALSLGARALAWSETSGLPALVSAGCQARGLVLGRLQREDTLRERSPATFQDVRRRATSGTEAWLEGEVLYHALSLPRVNALYEDASTRTLLNRNLRAILRGYAAVGVPLRYFGTEVLALLGHPVALVGYDQAASGAVLIEVLIGVQTPCVVRSALKREAPRSLASAMNRELSATALLAGAVNGIVERLELGTCEISLPVTMVEENVLPDTPASAVAIPLGVVEAVMAPQPRITGDLLVGSGALAHVERLASAALQANEPLSESVVEPLRRGPLDGARPADVLLALSRARQS